MSSGVAKDPACIRMFHHMSGHMPLTIFLVHMETFLVHVAQTTVPVSFLAATGARGTPLLREESFPFCSKGLGQRRHWDGVKMQASTFN